MAARLLPNPGEGNPPPFLRGDGTPLAISADPDSHVIADVFKIVNDPFVGKLGVFRVWQGTIRRDSQLLIDDGRKPFKVGHLFRLQGKAHVEIERGDTRRPCRRGQGRGDPFRRGAARLARRGPDQPGAAGLPRADVWPGAGTQAQGAGAETLPGAGAAGRGRPLLSRRAPQGAQRDRGARPVRPAPEGDAGTHARALRRGGGHPSAAHRLSRNHCRPRRRPPPAQEADRRRRPVRRGVPAHRAAAHVAPASSLSTRSRAA